MESDLNSTLSGESAENPNDESTVHVHVLLDEALHLSLDPILGDSQSKPTETSQINTSGTEICFKPHAYGKRHSILGSGSGNRSAFRKPDLIELREKYNKAKEKVKEWNLDKIWGGRVERMKRNTVASLSDIVTAAFWIREGVSRTPCERAASIPEIDDIEVYFKREYLNPSGSFYDRGARYALLRLHQSQKNIGVIATSTGNHAIALAYHGNSLGIPVTVLLPENTCPVIIRMCEKYGADVTVCGMGESELRERATKIGREKGLIVIDENDNPDVVSAQGTMGLEIVDQLEGVDAIIIPVGGGTLLAGTCIAVKTLYPSIKIIAVKSERRLDLNTAHHEGKARTTASVSKDLTTVDEMDYSEVSSTPLKLAEDLMDKCITVKEDLVALAVLRLLEYENVIVEANGAAGLAALLGGYLPELRGKRVVVVLSEGNMEPALLPQVIARGLTTDGRLIRFEARIDDQLGTMATLLRLIASTGAVIKDVSQEPAWNDPGMLCLQAKVMVEVRDHDHSRQLKSLLDQNFLVSFWSSAKNSLE